MAGSLLPQLLMQNGQYDARLVQTGAHVHTHVKRHSLTTTVSSRTGMKREQNGLSSAETQKALSPQECTKKLKLKPC